MSSRSVTTTRHPRPADPAATRERILDAAARYSAVAHRQPAIAELARQAGVSRPTVYRYFADGDALFRALWEREVGKLLDSRPFDSTRREDLVARIVEAADEISTHELLSATFTSDPGRVAHYILDRFGTSQRLIFDRLLTAIQTVQDAGDIRPGVPAELAAMVMLILQSAVQSRSMIAEFLSAKAWRRELARALDGYLRP